MIQVRTFSFGGGVQSTAALVLAAQRRIDFPLFVHANVGHDSENPATVTYIDEVAKPYAAEHGIELVILDRIKRDGTTETLHGRLTKPGSRSLPIPVRMSNGAPGTRSCTTDFKVQVLAKETKRRGATRDNPAIVAIGISADEAHRASNRRPIPHEQVVYPLLDWPIGCGTGRVISRAECERIIVAAGLPVPPKSACYFCPFHTPGMWRQQRREQPDLFEKSAELEDLLNERRATLGKDPVFLTRFAIPLRQAISDDPQLGDDLGDATCDTGSCFT